MVRKVPAVLVVVLVVVAGCAGGGTTDTGTGEDLTTVGSTTDDGGTVDGSTGSAGGGDGGAGTLSGEPVTLVENRTAALVAAGSYASVWHMRSWEDGTPAGEVTYEAAVDYGAERSHVTMSATANGTTRSVVESYYADGTSYQRLGAGSQVTYLSDDAAFAEAASPERTAFVSAVGSLAQFTPVGRETFHGVAVTRFELHSATSWLSAQQGSDGEVRWTDVTYTVLVDDEGLVRSEHWHATGVDESGANRTVEFRYELTDVGSTEVAEPAWLAEARSSGR